MIAQAVREAVPHKKSLSARGDLLSRINNEDPARHNALTEKLSALENAHQSMQQAQQDAGDARKESARQKIAQIKAKIQALQMMIGDNADSRARKIAQLARELSQAVRAYKAAGGQGMTAAGAGGASVTGQASTADVDGADSATAAIQASVVVAAGLQQVTAASASAQNTAARQADKDFAADVRGVARQLKNMQRGHRDDHGADRHLGQALRGLAGLGTAAGAGIAPVSVDVTV